MEQQKVDMFIASNGSNFPGEKLPFIREKLISMDDSRWGTLATIQFKNPLTSLLLSIFVGEFGIDRFYMGDTGLGVAKLLTCGGLGVWWLVDLFLVYGTTKEKNNNRLQAFLY